MNTTLLLVSIITVVFLVLLNWIAWRQKKRNKS